MRTVDDLVSQEVHYCASSLVLTVRAGYDLVLPSNSEAINGLRTLTEQAWDLCSPVLDWESAAIEEGWSKGTDEFDATIWTDTTDGATWAGDAQDCCDEHGIEPHEREIFELWIISVWLADKLEAKGERIDRDFAGLTIWGRTTTGQAISQDAVIQEIHAEASA